VLASEQRLSPISPKLPGIPAELQKFSNPFLISTLVSYRDRNNCLLALPEVDGSGIANVSVEKCDRRV
jgi:hypothetical protein